MKATRLTATIGSLALAGLFGSVLTSADGVPSPAHVMANPGAAKWGPAPPFLPPGAQIAVLAGDPSKSALYTVRLKFPSNYAIPAHSHPTDEHVVVASGELFMGMGDTLDRKAGLGLGMGGFGLMPAGANHYAYTKGATTILLYGVGPVEFKYANPADDPRTKTQPTSK